MGIRLNCSALYKSSITIIRGAITAVPGRAVNTAISGRNSALDKSSYAKVLEIRRLKMPNNPKKAK